MPGFRLAIAAAAALSLSLGAATAAPYDGPPVGKIEERIGPAAVGEARPFTARVSGLCESRECTADFGRKSNRSRTISLVNCAILGKGGQAILGSALLDDTQGVFIPVVARVENAGFEDAILNWTTPFTVPPGVLLRIRIRTYGTPTLSICNIQGTIEPPTAP